MTKFLNTIYQFLSGLLFPRFCLNCQREKNYLCQDCFSLIDILTNQYCPFCNPPKIVLDGKTCYSCRKSKKLTGLFCAASYQNFIIKKLISQFKYEPYVKELAKPLAVLIIQHFQLLDYSPEFLIKNPKDEVYPFQGLPSSSPSFLLRKNSVSDFVLIPVPLHKKRRRWRGFNQAEEISRQLSLFFNPVRDSKNKRNTQKEDISNRVKIPLISDCLLKTKQTLPQVKLSEKERTDNVKGAFVCQNKNLIKEKKILLVDDVFTTGSTMEECARVLKDSGAKEVWGIAAARE